MRYLTIIVIIALSSCSKGNLIDDDFCNIAGRYLDGYTIKQGKHAARPYIFDQARYRAGRLKWQFVFGEGTDYVLLGEDQIDQNKLLGISFHFFDRNRDAAMVSWWHTPDDGMINLGGYFHDNGERILDTKPAAQIRQCEVGEAELVIDYANKKYIWLLWVDGQTYVIEQEFTHDHLLSWEINSWFGGNNFAPNDMDIYKQIVNN